MIETIPTKILDLWHNARGPTGTGQYPGTREDLYKDAHMHLSITSMEDLIDEVYGLHGKPTGMPRDFFEKKYNVDNWRNSTPGWMAGASKRAFNRSVDLYKNTVTIGKFMTNDPKALEYYKERGKEIDSNKYKITHDEVTYDDMMASKGFVETVMTGLDFGAFETIASAPDTATIMASTALFGPAGAIGKTLISGVVGSYATARTGEHGTGRAIHQGREHAPTMGDFGVGAVGAIGSMSLDFIGAAYLLGKVPLIQRLHAPITDVKQSAIARTAGRTGTGAVVESATETMQSLVEYVSESLGTQLGFEGSVAQEHMISGAVAGLVAGGSIGGTIAGVQTGVQKHKVKKASVGQTAKEDIEDNIDKVNAKSEEPITEKQKEDIGDAVKEVIDDDHNQEILDEAVFNEDSASGAVFTVANEMVRKYEEEHGAMPTEIRSVLLHGMGLAVDMIKVAKGGVDPKAFNEARKEVEKYIQAAFHTTGELNAAIEEGSIKPEIVDDPNSDEGPAVYLDAPGGPYMGLAHNPDDGTAGLWVSQKQVAKWQESMKTAKEAMESGDLSEEFAEAQAEAEGKEAAQTPDAENPTDHDLWLANGEIKLVEMAKGEVPPLPVGGKVYLRDNKLQWSDWTVAKNDAEGLWLKDIASGEEIKYTEKEGYLFSSDKTLETGNKEVIKKQEEEEEQKAELAENKAEVERLQGNLQKDLLNADTLKQYTGMRGGPAWEAMSTEQRNEFDALVTEATDAQEAAAEKEKADAKPVKAVVGGIRQDGDTRRADVKLNGETIGEIYSEPEMEGNWEGDPHVTYAVTGDMYGDIADTSKKRIQDRINERWKGKTAGEYRAGLEAEYANEAKRQEQAEKDQAELNAQKEEKEGDLYETQKKVWVDIIDGDKVPTEEEFNAPVKVKFDIEEHSKMELDGEITDSLVGEVTVNGVEMGQLIKPEKVMDWEASNIGVAFAITGRLDKDIRIASLKEVRQSIKKLWGGKTYGDYVLEMNQALAEQTGNKEETTGNEVEMNEDPKKQKVSKDGQERADEVEMKEKSTENEQDLDEDLGLQEEEVPQGPQKVKDGLQFEQKKGKGDQGYEIPVKLYGTYIGSLTKKDKQDFWGANTHKLRYLLTGDPNGVSHLKTKVEVQRALKNNERAQMNEEEFTESFNEAQTYAKPEMTDDEIAKAKTDVIEMLAQDERFQWDPEIPKILHRKLEVLFGWQAALDPNEEMIKEAFDRLWEEHGRGKSKIPYEQSMRDKTMTLLKTTGWEAKFAAMGYDFPSVWDAMIEDRLTGREKKSESRQPPDEHEIARIYGILSEKYEQEQQARTTKAKDPDGENKSVEEVSEEVQKVVDLLERDPTAKQVTAFKKQFTTLQGKLKDAVLVKTNKDWGSKKAGVQRDLGAMFGHVTGTKELRSYQANKKQYIDAAILKHNDLAPMSMFRVLSYEEYIQNYLNSDKLQEKLGVPMDVVEANLVDLMEYDSLGRVKRISPNMTTAKWNAMGLKEASDEYIRKVNMVHKKLVTEVGSKEKLVENLLWMTEARDVDAVDIDTNNIPIDPHAKDDDVYMPESDTDWFAARMKKARGTKKVKAEGKKFWNEVKDVLEFGNETKVEDTLLYNYVIPLNMSQRKEGEIAQGYVKGAEPAVAERVPRTKKVSKKKVEVEQEPEPSGSQDAKKSAQDKAEMKEIERGSDEYQSEVALVGQDLFEIANETGSPEPTLDEIYAETDKRLINCGYTIV